MELKMRSTSFQERGAKERKTTRCRGEKYLTKIFEKICKKCLIFLNSAYIITFAVT